MRRVRLAIAAAALAAGVAVLVLTLGSDHADERVGHAILNALIVWSFVGSGLLAWTSRPANRLGALLAAVGFAWFAASLQLASGSVPFTIGLVTAALPLGFLAHLVLAFPDGRLGSRGPRVLVAGAYLASGMLQVGGALFLEPGPDAPACKACPTNAILLTRSDAAADALFTALNVAGVLIAVSVLVILARRWRGSTAPARRAIAPVLGAGAFAAVAGVALFASGIAGSGQVPAQLATYAVVACIPLAFVAGLLRQRLTGAAVSRLVLELGGAAAAPGRLREALARALGDPSLRLAYWLPESESWVDAVGRPVNLPTAGSSQTATIVERDGRRVGALVHDTVLGEQQDLVDAVCAAAGLALENERLGAELRARVDELRESEERLRALIDASPLAIVEIDPEAHVTFWNSAAERLYGWSSEEVIGQEVSFVPHHKEGEIDGLRARMLLGETIEVETARLRKDGSLVDVALSAGAVYDGAGDIVRFMAVSADITQRIRAQEELKHERDFISTLIDSAPVLVIVWDREGRLLRFNRECEQLTGYSAEEVEGQPFWDFFILPEEVERVTAALDRVWAGDYPSVNENVWLTRTGEHRLILWSNNALLGEDGQIEYVVSAGLDITDRKLAEEQLRESEARFRELANAAPVMIWMSDADGAITFFNDRWPEFTGRSIEEQLGDGWHTNIHPDDIEPGVALWLDTARSGAVYEQEYRLRRADGEWRWVFDRGIPRFLPDGSVAGYLGITIDITERKLWERELKASRARILEAQDAARRRLERNLHDGAQQRLVSLSLSLRLAQSKVSADPAEAEQLLAGAGDELAQALTELRELARGIHPAILTDRGLGAALEAVAGRASMPVELEIDLAERLPPPIEAAAYYVVSEALTNVAKYAQASLVTVSVARADGYAVVEVADDGVGGADPGRGSGLRGLFDRVEALEGRLEIASPPGSGTRIRAQIPVVVASAGEGSRPAEPGSASA